MKVQIKYQCNKYPVFNNLLIFNFINTMNKISVNLKDIKLCFFTDRTNSFM